MGQSRCFLFWVACMSMITQVGCRSLPSFDHPTVSMDQADVFPELFGTYRVENRATGEVHTLHVGGAGKSHPPGVLKCILVNHPVAGSEEAMGALCFGVFADRIGSHYIVHLPFSRGPEKPKPPANGSISNLTDVEGYFLLRVTCGSEGLLVAWQDPDFIEKEIETGAIPGILKTGPRLVSPSEASSRERSSTPRSEPHETTRVTASSLALRDFVARTVTTGLFDAKNTTYQRVNPLPHKD